MDICKIKVTLGGSVTDRILSFITNYFLTQEEPIIHFQVEKIIKNKIKDLNKMFQTDFNLIDIKLNSSLVATPIIEPNF
jgi:hypothetical protein